MKKITLFGIFILTLFLLITPAVSSIYNKKDTKEITTENTTKGKALIASIYLELDPNSQ